MNTLHRKPLSLLALVIVLVISSLGVSDRVPQYLSSHETDEPLVPSDPPVKRRDVYELKVRLKSLGFYRGSMDERYDPETIVAVKEFQKSFWLRPDGVVDGATWRALGHGIVRPIAAVTGPPPDGVIHLEVDTENLQLTVCVDGEPWKTYPIAVGKWGSLTPVGDWKIVEKGYEQGGAFGSRWMGLNVPWGGYGIHGTNRPWSIGTYASIGCIRMFNQDVEEIYEMVGEGTRVLVRGPRPYLDFGRFLREQDVGPEVVLLQESLKAAGFDPGDCDGRLGPMTVTQIKEINWLFGLGFDDVATFDLFALLGMRGDGSD